MKLLSVVPYRMFPAPELGDMLESNGELLRLFRYYRPDGTSAFGAVSPLRSEFQCVYSAAYGWKVWGYLRKLEPTLTGPETGPLTDEDEVSELSGMGIDLSKTEGVS